MSLKLYRYVRGWHHKQWGIIQPSAIDCIEKAQQQKEKNYTHGIAIGAFAKIISKLYNLFAYYVWQFIQRIRLGINIRTGREVISKHGGV